MKGVAWLVSYPKSGNTWLRALLTNYLSETGEPVSINRLRGLRLAADRETLEDFAGVDSSELNPREIELLRPRVNQAIVNDAQDLLLIKVHERFRYAPDGRPLFTPGPHERTIYMIRNPLDVAVSFAHHLSQSVDEAIRLMGSGRYGLCMETDTAVSGLPEPLGSWSDHVTSWLDDAGVSPLILRYEDLVESPIEQAARVLRFLELEPERVRLDRAVEHSTFARLQEQERHGGFRERQPTAPSFFRAGATGGWRTCLSAAQTERLIDEHRTTMRRLGYIDDTGRVTS